MSTLKFKFDKLVRDKVPNELEQKGVKLYYKILDSSNRIFALKSKLLEEVQELLLAQSSYEILSELCDVHDVLEFMHRLLKYEKVNIDRFRICFNNSAFKNLLKAVQRDDFLENYQQDFSDIEQILYNISRHFYIATAKITDARITKNEKFGGFLLGIFAKYVEINSRNHNAIQYFRNQPEKYPLIQ